MKRADQRGELPPLPRHPSRGVSVSKGDRVSVTNLSIAVADPTESEDTESRVLHLRIPPWISEHECGATYLLRRRVKGGVFDVNGAGVHIGQDGWSVEVALRQTPSDLIRSTSALARRVLDILAAEAFQISELKDPLRQHGLWFRNEAGITLRSVGTARLAVGMQSTIEVRDPDDIVRPGNSPELKWHASHSYFRRSQFTDDLHDAYRNLYLALEALLSEVCPWEVGTGERKWLESALRHTVEGYGLDMQGFVGGDGGDPYSQFMKEQYAARRCALFHSKLGESPTIPSDLAARDELVIATRRLGRLYVELAKLVTGAAFAGGIMAEYVFERMMKKSFSDAYFYISEEADFLASACVMSSVNMVLNVDGRGGLHHLKGTWASSDIPSRIRRIGIALKKDGNILDGGHDRADIDSSGASNLEVVIQQELTNANSLREWFL